MRAQCLVQSRRAPWTRFDVDLSLARHALGQRADSLDERRKLASATMRECAFELQRPPAPSEARRQQRHPGGAQRKDEERREQQLLRRPFTTAQVAEVVHQHYGSERAGLAAQQVHAQLHRTGR